MLKLNIRRVFILRGIENPLKAMMETGISRPTASNLLNNKVASISSAHTEKICEILNCEPNDLYEWTPSPNMQNAETHPLSKLKREAAIENIKQILKNISLDKLGKLDSLLDEINKSAPPKDS